jgi:hypothetical protein
MRTGIQQADVLRIRHAVVFVTLSTATAMVIAMEHESHRISIWSTACRHRLSEKIGRYAKASGAAAPCGECLMDFGRTWVFNLLANLESCFGVGDGLGALA